MKKIELIPGAASILLLIACAAGCIKTTDNNKPGDASSVSNNSAPPAMNAGAATVTNAGQSPAPLSATGTPPPPTIAANSRPPATAVGKPPAPVVGSGGNDFYLFSQIHGQINQDEQLRNTNIVVKINAGVVTLTGTVANPEQKGRVEQLAHGVQGVKDVKNQLRVAAGNSKS